ncbi:hypothetical protein Mpt1_c03570 [Candidatus Methanoplasma termitum]|uniref:Outer membrane protein assembly factor BamB n=1 Tax=Candidatus Methanoplasma termitum TaxID=1577791 RepID=A0A0A7LB72_9ARCH|nr:PQQ-binding-like beta-propeller repeat protein [Candidatus Methanoplasma termitum]AIZ56253.1 hypothetical protein Mpt1_c03570 [Candidatus Methanoplasma termitum]MCL2333771.1 PQQ-binding-like beta-propeller repeat protein [Candidatus Methanoplasma sp.]
MQKKEVCVALGVFSLLALMMSVPFAELEENSEAANSPRSEVAHLNDYAVVGTNILELNRAGGAVWHKELCSLGHGWFCSAVVAEDGFVAVGSTYAKFDLKGDLVWQRTFDDPRAFYTDIIAVDDGFVAADIRSMIKFDDSGDIIWQNDFKPDKGNYLLSFAAVADGFVIVEATMIPIDGGRAPLEPGMTFIKFDRNGNVLWQKYVPSETEIRSMAPISNGFVAVNNKVMKKFDYDGNMMWQSRFDTQIPDDFNAVAAVPGGFIAVGEVSKYSFGEGIWGDIPAKGGGSDATIVKFSEDGDIIWSKIYGGRGSDEFEYVAVVSGGIVVGGISAPASADGTYPGFWGNTYDVLVKYDDNGNVDWVINNRVEKIMGTGIVLAMIVFSLVAAYLVYHYRIFPDRK